MRLALNAKLASFRDFRWWMDKEQLRFTYIAALIWVRLKDHGAGTLTLILGPVNIKLHIAWQAGLAMPGEINQGESNAGI